MPLAPILIKTLFRPDGNIRGFNGQTHLIGIRRQMCKKYFSLNGVIMGVHQNLK